MAFRQLLREPAKRMLIFFNVDQTTTVLDTAKVQKILEGDKIEEGARVLVKFGKDDFEARVIKLHDDPSVLLEAETEFLTQMFGAGIDENPDDKENTQRNTPTAEPTARPALVDKTNSVTPQPTKKRRKAKSAEQPKAKKAKKIITIEAESLPDEPYVDGDENGKENEGTKEPLSFLHASEQEKVRKLVAQYQKIGEAEVGVQTDTLKKPSKEIGVQMNGNSQPNCSCHDVLLEKVTILENKLDKLVSALGNSEKKEKEHSSPQEPISFDSFDEESDLMRSISEVASICSNNTLPGMITTMEEETTEQASVASPSVSALSPIVYDELFKKSSSVSNYAKNLVFEMFSEEQLKDSNCCGAHQKKSLEKDPRMDLIKETTFKKFPMEDRRKTWAACRKAIDSAIRKLRYKH